MTKSPTFKLSSYYFIYFAGIGAFTPYFALFLATRGISAFEISLLMALWYGARIFSPFVWNHYTQRSANPVQWLRWGSIATTIALVFFVLPQPFAALFAVMSLFSFFYNALMPQFETITLSHLGENISNYGRIRLWGSAGFIAAVVLLGLVFDLVSVSTLPWWMLPIFFALIYNSYHVDYAASDHPDTPHESWFKSLARPGVLTFLALAFIMQIAHGPLYVFYSLYLQAQGFSATAIGLFWALGVLAEITLFWYAAPIIKQFGAHRLIVVALAAAAIRFVLIALFPKSVFVLIFAQLMHAITFGLFYAACMQRLTELFKGKLIGQGQSMLYALSSGIGGVIGALMAGSAWSHGGGQSAFLFGAVAAGLGVLLARVVSHRKIFQK